MSNQYMPPMRASEEAKSEELNLARKQGKSYIKALKHMVKDVADDGSETRVGDYIVAYAIEKAEGMYAMENGELMWHEPQEENIHIEVAVRDGADNRFIPNLTIRLTLIDPQGREVGTHHQPYIWHPWLYHYGRNWKVDQSGNYKIRVWIEAPDFPRHDEKNGKRFAEDVKVEFENVKIELEKQK